MDLNALRKLWTDSGISLAVTDQELIRFWTLEETLGSARENDDALYLDFADYSIHDSVVYQGSLGDQPVAASFEEFVDSRSRLLSAEVITC